MPKPIAYFALGFSMPGCLLHGEPQPYAINTRRELVEAIADQFYNRPIPRAAMAHLNVRRLWAHVKRHGLSSIFLELPAGGGEVLCLMGMTESEYTAATAALDLD